MTKWQVDKVINFNLLSVSQETKNTIRFYLQNTPENVSVEVLSQQVLSEAKNCLRATSANYEVSQDFFRWVYFPESDL